MHRIWLLGLVAILIAGCGGDTAEKKTDENRHPVAIPPRQSLIPNLLTRQIRPPIRNYPTNRIPPNRRTRRTLVIPRRAMTPEEQFAALEQEFQDSQRMHSGKKVMAAPPAERRAIFNEENPCPQNRRLNLLSLRRPHTGSEVGNKALLNARSIWSGGRRRCCVVAVDGIGHQQSCRGRIGCGKSDSI